MIDVSKKTIGVTVVGVLAVGATYFLGGDLNWTEALTILIDGDISVLCENLENVDNTETLIQE